MEEKKMKYSQMEERLNEIITKLSDTKIDLDEQIALFKEGKNLVEKMQAKLEEFKSELNKE